MRISNTTSNKVELLTTNGIWNIDVLEYQALIISERKYPPIDLSKNDDTLSGQEYGDGNYVVAGSHTFADYYAFKYNRITAFGNYNYNSSTGYYVGSDYIVNDYKGDYVEIKLPKMIKLTKYKFKKFSNNVPLSDYKILEVMTVVIGFISSQNINFILY